MLPPRKRRQRRRLIHRLRGAILEDVVRPSRVAREDVTQRAVVDHRGPCPVPLDNLTRAIEVGSLALDLLETSGLSQDHGLGAGLARLELCAVGDAVRQLAGPLSHVRRGLAEHASDFARGLHSVEARDALQSGARGLGLGEKGMEWGSGSG